ncbi:MAG: TetR/AcrR family transcriptional regulator [Proteobacteria bacterium]|nr:TetR/AcrR family transcriptional regulator [Pseudomonadota bacterium]
MADTEKSRRGATRRTNAQRHAETRAALLASARTLFAEKGFAETGTPEIVTAAGVTRGALYYHFADKRDLFRAVLEAEEEALAARINRDSGPLADDPVEALMAGTKAFLAAATDAGTNRIVFVDGPAALGWDDWREIDDRFAGATLREGLEAGMRAGVLRPLPLDEITNMLGAAFNEAALGLGGGRYRIDALEKSFRALFEGLRA